MKNTSNINLR